MRGENHHTTQNTHALSLGHHLTDKVLMPPMNAIKNAKGENYLQTGLERSQVAYFGHAVSLLT
jgi:hypothetical protein